MGKLTTRSVAALGPGRHHDGDCLLLEVRPKGSRSWLARVRHNGKRRDIGLGSATVISLARARERCREVRLAIAEGRDPLDLWKPPPAMARLFSEVALEFIEQREITGKSRQQALSRLKAYAFPRLGKLQIQSVDADNIAEALRPIWTAKPETALRTRDLILRTLRFARPDGALLETTLARAISDRLPAQPRNKNFAAMPYSELPGFLTKLATKRTMGALALQAVSLHEWLARGGHGIIRDWAERLVADGGAVRTGDHAPMSSRKRALIEGSRSDGERLAIELGEHLASLGRPVILRTTAIRAWIAIQRGFVRMGEADLTDRRLEKPDTILRAMKKVPGITVWANALRPKFGATRDSVVMNFAPAADVKWPEIKDRLTDIEGAGCDAPM